MKKILITGGAGFIGSHLTSKLLKKGYFVISLDNFDPFYPKIFKQENIEKFIKSSHYRFHQADIRQIKQLKPVFNKYECFDSVIHLAAKAGVRPSIDNPLAYQKTNLEGTYNLLSVCTLYKPKQFVFASSSSIYGKSPIPFSEKTMNQKPLSPYGATKLSGEHIVFTFQHLYKIPTTVLRFFSVYGPAGRPDMAPYLFTDSLFKNKAIKQFGDGQSARDWTYINDLTEALEKTIVNPFSYEVINLGSSKPIKLNLLISTIENLTGKRFKKIILPQRSDEPKITYANISKAKRKLAWQPKTDFQKGMEKFIKWYKKNRLSYK